MEGVEIADTLTHDGTLPSWVIHLRLTIAEPSDMVPATTDWYVRIDPAYPLGFAAFQPAQDGGLHRSFRHMTRNDYDGGLWRNGVPCLDRPGRWLGSLEMAGQPDSAVAKLRFHVGMALKWLEFAAKDTLTAPEEPFELPRFTDDSDASVVGFDESPDRFAIWQPLLGRFGRCVVRRICENTVALDSFLLRDASVTPSRWGARIDASVESLPVFWMSLPEMPVIAPWDVPNTWGEMRAVARKMGVDFDGGLRWIYHKIREANLTGDQVLLIGFPIPDVYDGPPAQMHWQPLCLPRPIPSEHLTHARPGSQGAWPFQLARTLSDDQPLQWLRSENWSEQRLRVRGSLDEAVRNMRTVIIGAGALGSALAEMLVREGLNDLLIIDHEKLEMGNLRRHVLTAEEVGQYKARALATRLNSVSPFARVRYVAGWFPQRLDEDRSALHDADLIIDCTANEDVIGHLARQKSNGRKRWFFVGSLGVDARRLFLYSEHAEQPDAARYKVAMREPFAEEKNLIAERGLAAMHGAGCWNPVFPARWSDVQILAAEMLKGIERGVRRGTSPETSLETIWLRAA